MKIINLIKSEFIKNYTIKKLFSISLIIFIITILFVELYNINFYSNFTSSNYRNYLIEELENKSKLTQEDEFNLAMYKEEKNYYDYLNSFKHSHWDYRTFLVLDLIVAKKENLAIEIYKENKDSEEIKYICNSDKEYFNSAYEGTISYVCDRKDEIDKIYEDNKKKIEDYENLLDENKYYKYVEYQIKEGLVDEEDIPLANILIDNKIDNPYHYLSFNYRHYFYLNDKYSPETEEEYSSGEREYASYDDYLRFEKKLTSDAKKMKAIIKYSSENKIPHDLSFNDYDGIYQEDIFINTKNSVNFIFHYSVIVMIIVAITSGGIVSKEHSSGTIKKIITAPIKRWKILLSKFIYLILHTYIIWIICLIILSIYSGIKYGFNDLFTPKLIYTGSKVIEVNYFLNLLKELFIASIPVICFLSILLFLSTVTLNTSLTTGVCSLISILSVISWYLISHIKMLIVTPLIYFDTGFIYMRSRTYMEALTQVDISYSYGIVISILVTLILFIITTIIYNKRDIIS